MSDAFKKAAEEVKTLASDPTDQEKLEIYALYKQVSDFLFSLPYQNSAVLDLVLLDELEHTATIPKLPGV